MCSTHNDTLRLEINQNLFNITAEKLLINIAGASHAAFFINTMRADSKYFGGFHAGVFIAMSNKLFNETVSK